MKKCCCKSSAEFPIQTELIRIEGCVSGISAYREDIRDISTGIITQGSIVTESTVTGDFSPFPCKYTNCVSKCPDELNNCCCINPINVDITQLSGGYVNQFFGCSTCCKEGDFSYKFKLCNFVNDALLRVGLTDNCNSTNTADMDVGFYVLQRAGLATPYHLTYVFQGNSNLGTWVNYDRVGLPKCEEYEIKRIGTNIEYYVNGALKYTKPDPTNKACLQPYLNVHGSYGNDGSFTMQNINYCQIA